jgi:hypothetical protein
MRAAIVLAGLGFGLLVMGSAGSSASAGPLAQATATSTSTATPTRTATPHCQIQMRRGTLATPTWVPLTWWMEQWGLNC